MRVAAFITIDALSRVAVGSVVTSLVSTTSSVLSNITGRGVVVKTRESFVTPGSPSKSSETEEKEALARAPKLRESWKGK